MRKFINIINESIVASTINGLNVDEFMRGYIEAMLWSSTNDDDMKNVNINMIASETMDKIKKDCVSFLEKAGSHITYDKLKRPSGSLEASAGHDFWLTRVGHGAGFWDGDWVGEEHDGDLTRISEEFGLLEPYVGDDGLIYF